MPIYEYKCKKCGHKFEKLVFGKEKIKCEKCGTEQIEKLFSNFAISQKSNNSSSCEGGTCDVGCPTCGN